MLAWTLGLLAILGGTAIVWLNYIDHRIEQKERELAEHEAEHRPPDMAHLNARARELNVIRQDLILSLSREPTTREIWQEWERKTGKTIIEEPY